MLLRYISIVLLSILSSALHAQILNIERLRLEEDTTKNFLGKGILGINANNRSADPSEPVRLFGINTSLNAVYQPGQHAYILVGQSDYLEVNDDEVLNFGFVHLRANFLRDKKRSYEVFSQYSYDLFRGLDPRLLAGGGVRQRIFKTEKSDFFLGIGAFYESETWSHPTTDESVEISLWKSTNYLKFQTTINSAIDLNTVVYYQVGYDPTAILWRNRVSGNLNISSKITKRISLNNSFEMSYEDKPIVPITKFIYSLKVGLSVNI